MTKIKVYSNILKANDNIAQRNRKLFKDNKVYTINLMSSPGSGKTSLLEKTIALLKDEVKVAVLVGDLQTTNDAQRIEQYGIPVVQINTDGACHLDANMVESTLPSFNFREIELFIIENIGNLVCPADFDLGEEDRVIMVSVPEGDDKPIKYPVMFYQAKLLLINKIDLLPYTNFDMNRIKKDALKINPRMRILEISCYTGEGIVYWINWLKEQMKNKFAN